MRSSLSHEQAVLNGSLPKIINEWLKIADIEANGHRPFDIQIHNPLFYKRVIQHGSLGLGESYMDGWWDCNHLDVFFHRVLAAGLEHQLPSHLKDLMTVAATHLINFQSKKRAWIVGKKHYDLGNDLFKLILDPYMQYSCGYWKTAQTLEEAQEAKLKMICEKLYLKPGMTLLDIGCGWGGLAYFAAKNYQVKVHGVTISKEQQELAQQRCKDLDVKILLQDYRDLNQQYDRVVSVGMFEHVGPKNYSTYFDVVSRNLKSDGLFLLHTIGAKETSVGVDAWINKYIFPNGCLPSVAQIAQASEQHFVLEDLHNFGADYDYTLMAWYKRFNEGWHTLSSEYDERFKRMFNYYLNACAGAFRARDLQLWQILFSPNGVTGGIQVPR
jgi:cyclopropane-fatty-acyl-phospholipid synthase